MGFDLFAMDFCQGAQGILSHGEHSTRAAGAIVQQVGAGLDLVGDGQEDQFSHQPHHIPRRPVFAGLFVIFLVEAADQFLKDRAHAVVVQARMFERPVAIQHRGRAQVDGRIH